MSLVQRHVLSNGTRVALEPVPSSASVSIHVVLLAGSRHEPEPLGGATHFLEHLLFKGTARRDLHAIAREINLLGGVFDASTSTDTLRLSNRVIGADVRRCLELMDEMLFEPALPPAEIERERGVILEEIAEYNDSPEDLAFDNFLAQMWLPDALGRPVLGEPAGIEALRRGQLVDWWQAILQPGSLVVSLAGGLDPRRVLDDLEATFGRRAGSSTPPPRPAAARPAGGQRFVDRDLEQVQFYIGVPSLGSRDPRRYTLAALDTILGGTAGSRLFVEIREKHGLAYTIASMAQNLVDEGFLAIYGSTTAANLPRVQAMITEQVEQLCDHGPTDDEVDTAFQNHERSYLLALESNSFRAGRNASRIIHDLPDMSDADVVEQFRRVTREGITELARELFRGVAQATSLVGPQPRRKKAAGRKAAGAAA